MFSKENKTTKNRGIFLDRDGVINQAVVENGRPFPPASLKDMVIIPGVYEALTKLKSENWFLIVVTNQPDVARGLTSKSTVEEINQYLKNYLPIDEILSCFHDNSDQCLCRKPQPGLILQAAKKYGIELASSFMIGDRWRDVQAGQSAGCKTIFIDYEYKEKRPDTYDYKVSSFKEASRIIRGQ
ncbi:HAD family hydrolase [Amylibacter sp.]|nr:HAD family hydrolase [Amylibacter sp.]